MRGLPTHRGLAGASLRLLVRQGGPRCEWIRSHLTYANVMATLAVFLVLGGGTAVALSGHNTVQSDDLGPGAQVKAADVANNAVNGANIADNSVTGNDVNESTLNGPCVADAGLQPGCDWPPGYSPADRARSALQAQRYLRQQPGFPRSRRLRNRPRRALRETEVPPRWTMTRPTRVTSPKALGAPANVETKVIKLNADSGFGRDGNARDQVQYGEDGPGSLQCHAGPERRCHGCLPRLGHRPTG